MIGKLPLWLACGIVAVACYAQLRHVPEEVPVSIARCYAPGTDPAFIAEGEMSAGIQLFQVYDYWTQTATDGGGVSRGAPITLTWGVVPDGTTIPSFGLGSQAGSDLRARLDEIYGDEATWMPLFQEVFDRWAEVTGITYVHVTTDDAAGFSSSGSASPGVVGVRPDIRIGGRPIDGNGKILAFNFLPTIGDMVIDTNDNYIEDTSDDSLMLRNIVSHEHGHGIGLVHVCPINQTKLMEPFLSSNFDGPQHDDILGAQRLHGDPLEPNDALGTASELGIVSVSPIGAEMVSLDGANDSDYFRFSTTVPETVVTVTLSPQGETYLEGPQNSDGSCSVGSNIDSQSRRNLGIAVLDHLGNEVASAYAEAAGVAEVLEVPLGVSLGPYYVKVTGDTTDSIQLYDLSLTSPTVISDLAVNVTAAPELVYLGEEQVIDVTIGHSGPGSSTETMLVVDVTDSMVVDTAFLSRGDGVVSIMSGQQVTVDFGAMVGPSQAVLTLVAHHVSAESATISAQVSRGQPDLVESNNSAVLESSPWLGGPSHVEDFDRFSGYAGDPGFPVPNDTTGFFDLRYDFYSTTTMQGFALDSTVAMDGRGLFFLAEEDNALQMTVEFPAEDYVERRHQIAFWFRFEEVSGSPDDSLTQVFSTYNRGATDFAYYLRCGKDTNGVSGASLVVPIGGGMASDPLNSPLAPDTWHTAVIQYTSASDTTTLDAGVKLWFNPANENAAPDFEITTASGNMGAENGYGPFGRYAFGSAKVPANPDGPAIWLDQLGTWDGFGSNGLNDLSAAIKFLYSYVSVDDSLTDLATKEGGTIGGDLMLALNRRGETGVSADVAWEIVPVGESPVDEMDFPGGSFPSGTLHFAVDDLRKVVRIPIAGDFDVEGDETFEVRLTTVDSVTRLDQTVLSGTILGNDLLETEVSIDSGGDLVIQDVQTTDDDTLTLRHDVGDGQIVISDPNRLLGTEIAGAIGNGTNEVKVPTTSISGGKITVLTEGGDDRLIIDLSDGALPNALNFDGGESSLDVQNVLEIRGVNYSVGVLSMIDSAGVEVNLDDAVMIDCVNVQRVEGDIGLNEQRLQYSSTEDMIELSSPVTGKTLVTAVDAVDVLLSHPSSLVVQSGGGDDRMTVSVLDADYPVALSLDGEDGMDEIVLAAPLSMAGAASFSCVAESVMVRAGETQVAGGVWLVDGRLSLDGQDLLTLETGLSFAGGSQLDLVVGEDQLDLQQTASIDISESTLGLLVPPAAFTAGEVLPLISVAPNASVTGRFKFVDEGAEVGVGASIYRVTYVGGDGNDVSLTTLMDYGQWSDANFPPTELARAPGDDPDRDDWPNGLAYLLGLDPTSFEDVPYTLVISESESILTYTRASFLPSSLEVVEWTQNLVDWFPVTASPTENGNEISYSIPSCESDARQFFRIRVALAP